jgi:predicted small integral membrane protein
MTIGTDNNKRVTLLRRNPVLTAMMVSSLVLGITALVAAITVWRASSSCSIPRKTVLPYVVQAVGATRGDVLV